MEICPSLQREGLCCFEEIKQLWKRWHHRICTADATVAVALRKTCSQINNVVCLLGLALWVLVLWWLRGRTVITLVCTSHFTAWSQMRSCWSQTHLPEMLHEGQTLRSIGQWDRFAFSSDRDWRFGYTQENVLICPFRCYRQKTKATAELRILFMHNELVVQCRSAAAKFWSLFNLTHRQSRLSHSSFFPHHNFLHPVMVILFTFNYSKSYI